MSMIAAVSYAAETSVEQRSGDDLYSAGASVQVSEATAGDAVLAGGTVLVTGTVSQDVLAAGGSITLTGAVEDDIRAAGGSITVTDAVGGDAILAGGSVTLARASGVGGNAWVAGGVLRLSGAISGDLRAAGGEVVLGGRIDGNADVYSESLEVLPGTVIAGTLHYRGPQPAVVADDAEIGNLQYTESDGFDRPAVSILGGLLAALLVFLSLAVCALIYLWLLPGLSREAAGNARDRMLLSLGVGVLTVLLTPMLAAVLFALLVTAPIAIALFAAYVVALVLGALTTVACLGHWLRDRFLSGRGDGAGTTVISVLLAGVAFWVVGLVPFIGALVVMLAFTTGIGGLILAATRLYKKPS
jgi:hypothetical protein